MIPSGEFFTTGEVSRASSGDIPDAYASNAENMVVLLDMLRAAGGVPLALSSFYRDTGHNAAVGGATASPHLQAAAADVTPLGMGIERWALAIWQAGPVFGQLIIYPHTDGHAHVTLPGFPNGAHRQTLVLVGNPNKYAAWTPGQPVPPWGSGYVTLPTLPENEGGVPVSWLPWLAIGVLVLGLFFKWWRV